MDAWMTAALAALKNAEEQHRKAAPKNNPEKLCLGKDFKNH